MFVGNMLIGLREGIESCLILSILTALLIRGNRRGWIVLVRIGLGAALVVSVIAGWLLAYSNTILGATGRAVFVAAMSAVAIVFVSGMIFWMRHPPQVAEEELNGRLAKALRLGPAAVLIVSFLAVLREGIEAATFVFITTQESGGTLWGPLLSLLAGMAIAVALTWLLYRRAVRINMSTLFTATSFLLISVGAGVLGEGLRALQEAGVLSGAHQFAFNIGSILPADSWYGSLLTGILNISVRPTVLQAVAWGGYWVVVASLLLRATRRPVVAVPDQHALVSTEIN